jgi:putative hemolysin
MTFELALQLFAFFALLCASAFFSSSETALFSLDPHEVNRLDEEDPGIAKRLRELLHQPTRILSTVLIGNTLVNVVFWILGASILTQAGMANELAQVGLLTLVTLIFGEYGPKRLAILVHVPMARLYARPLGFLIQLLKIPRRGLEVLTDRFSHVFLPSGHILARDEYHTLVEAGGEYGSLDEHEHTMVQAILALETRYVGDVMTPRVDIEGIDLADESLNLYAEVKKTKLRYLVLYREQLDEIVGLLNVRAFLLDPEHNIQRATRTPLYIPEQSTLDKLLTQMIAGRHRAAVVVDEYGGTAGLITRGDILEELTGEMDTDDDERLVFEPLTERAWLIDGQMSLGDVNRRTGLKLESETADRMAGWFIEKAEHIPKVNEIVQGDGFKAMVRQMRRNRILLVLVEKQAAGEEPA